MCAQPSTPWRTACSAGRTYATGWGSRGTPMTGTRRPGGSGIGSPRGADGCSLAIGNGGLAEPFAVSFQVTPATGRGASHTVQQLVVSLVTDALAAGIEAGDFSLSELPPVEPERPRDLVHGDWATSVALRSAKAAGMPPRALAEAIAARIQGHPDVAEVDVAGPGFINIRLSARALQRVIADVRAAGASYGRSD